MKKYNLITTVIVFLLLSGTSHAIDIGKVIGSAVTGVKKVAEASKEITPSEEHYIGRTIAAMVLDKYPLVQNEGLTQYVNKVGLLVAYVSERPETYGGYHFAVVENSEPNAYACPGGLIFMTTGLLNQIKNEDQLAVVLGHEVAHVAHRDGINAIKKSKWTDLGFYAAGEAAGQFSSSNLKELTNVFNSVIADVAKKVIESGYSQADEKKADAAGVRYASELGYDPNGIVGFLKEESAKGTGGKGGPFSSHPKPDTRMKDISAQIEKDKLAHAVADIRTNRYKQAIAAR